MTNDIIYKSKQYKFAYLKKLVIELRARQKEFYHSYEPPRIGGQWVNGKYTGGEYSQKHLNFHKSGKKIRIIKGAPRSSKTTTTIMEIAMIIKGEHPFVKKYDNLSEIKRRVWVLGGTFKKIQEVLMPMFLSIIPKNDIKHVTCDVRSNKYYIEMNNKWIIVFKSHEEKIDTITSADATLILMDERLDNPDWREQIRSRIITTDGMLFYTMDSNEEDEWTQELKQLSYADLFEFELKDNESNIPEGEFDRLNLELDDVAKEKLIYGKHVNRDIQYIFTANIWNESNYIEIQPQRFSVMYGQVSPDENGYLKIFKQPIQNVRYVIGFDPAGGNSRNSHGMQVFDQFGEQCAIVLDNTFHYVNAPEDFIIPIMTYFNNATLISENREHGRWVVNKVAEMGLSVYSDTMWKPIGTLVKTQIEYGIVTNEQNKHEMKDKTYNDLVNNKLIIHDRLTKLQLDYFVEDFTERDSQKKAGKLHGTKIMNEPDLKNSDDDLVMALFFADRALNNYGYLNSITRKAFNAIKPPQTIDDVMNLKLIRKEQSYNIYRNIGY